MKFKIKQTTEVEHEVQTPFYMYSYHFPDEQYIRIDKDKSTCLKRIDIYGGSAWLIEERSHFKDSDDFLDIAALKNTKLFNAYNTEKKQIEANQLFEHAMIDFKEYVDEI
jgi:hypothetical protein